MLWRPDDTRIIVLNGQKDVGWLETRLTGSEVFLKQLYVAPAHQRQGIGSRVVRKLLHEWHGRAALMALFVLKNNPAARLYKRLGFAVVQETRTKFVMRGELIDCALGGHRALQARVHTHHRWTVAAPPQPTGSLRGGRGAPRCAQSSGQGGGRSPEEPRAASRLGRRWHSRRARRGAGNRIAPPDPRLPRKR